MKSTHKQTALKASLFMILAANVSWQTSKSFNLVSHQEMHSIDLAQTAPPSELRGGSVPSRTGGAVVSTTVPAIRVAAPPSTAPGPKPDAPIAAVVVETREKTVKVEICSLDFKIHYIEGTSAATGKPLTHAYVTQMNPERTFDGLKEEGTFNDLVGTEAKRASWFKLISDGVTRSLKQEGRKCDGSDETSTPVVERTERKTRVARTEDDADDARIERGRRNCTLDEDGEALRNSDKASCNLQRLASINLDRSSDDDDRDEARGERRRRRDSSSAGIQEVKEALEPLKTSIRQLMLSSNSKRRSDGDRLMNRVLAALAKVEGTAVSSSDERAMKKISDGLDKSYTLGQRVNELAAEKADKLSEIDDKISDLQIRATTSQNPYEQFNLQRQAYAWTQYRSNELSKLTQNSDYLKLRAYQTAGLIDSEEFADFTADFNSLAQTNQSASPGGYTASTDVINGRSNLGDSRAQGSTLPAYPQINYSGLGLNNPAVAGGTNPMIPSPTGYPQTSGYPVTTGYPQTAMPYQTTPFQTMPGQYSMPSGQYGMPSSQFGVPYSNMPNVLPTNVPITQGYGQPQQFPTTQTGWQSTAPGYYNPSVMSQPMRYM